MPLGPYVEDRVAALRVALADPNAVALEVVTRPETQLPAAKLLAAACDGDESDLLIGFSATFTDAPTFCAELRAAVDAEVEVALEALDGEQLALRLPTEISDDPSIPFEVRLVEYLERIAWAMHNHVRRIVIALDIETEDASGWADMLARLLANTGSGRLLWAKFGNDQALPPIAYHRHRTAVRSAPEELEQLLTVPGGRVLTFIGHASATAVVQTLRRRDARGKQVWVTLEVPTLSFLAPLEYYTEAKRALAKQLQPGAHVGPLVAEAEEPAAYGEAELDFADFCARLAVAALRPGVGMVVVLRSPPHADPGEYSASLHRLASAAISTRVKFVTFDPLRDCAATPSQRSAHRWEFDLGPERIEAGIDAELAKPDLPARDRLQMTMALAGLRLGQEKYEEAFGLHAQTLQMAEAQAPADAAVAWYQYGNANYHMSFFEDAEEAYAEAAHRAFEADQSGLAGMALTGAGHALFSRAEFAAALEAYESATSLFNSLGLLQHEIYARTWVGQTCVMQRRFAEGREAFETALERCNTVDPLYAKSVEPSKAEILHRMAQLYALAGRPDLERTHREQAAALGVATAPCLHP